MRRHIILAAAAVSFAMVSASAQNLNPTVEVTNSYSGKAVDAVKPSVRMAVPDSLLRFDLDFDYSVFSNPYKGGYDFSPYLLDMRPDADAYKANKFYLRAGAGYTVNPEFDLVWSPKLKREGLRVDVSATHRSYVGNYANLAVTDVWNAPRIGIVPTGDDRTYWTGYNMLSKADVKARYDWARSYADFRVGYIGIDTKNDESVSHYRGADFSLGYHSNDNRDSYFYYDARLDYRHSADDAKYSGLVELQDWNSLKINDLGVKFDFGPVFDERHAVLVGTGMEISDYSKAVNSQVGHLYIAPHYVFTSYRMRALLGVKVDMAINSKGEVAGHRLNQSKGQVFYPDVKFNYQLIREHLDVYANVTGGVIMNSYSSMKEYDHFFNYASAFRSVNPMSDNTIERLNASLGFRGSIASRFRFDISGGYAGYTGYRFYSLETIKGDRPVFGFADASVLYAKLKYVLDLPQVLVDGNVAYTHDNLRKNEIMGFGVAPLTADIRARYSWRDRIFAGVHADMATSRKSWYTVSDVSVMNGWAENSLMLNGWVNLGLDAEYSVNRKFSVWVKADNLLNQTIQRTPFYAEKGIKFSLGICFNL